MKIKNKNLIHFNNLQNNMIAFSLWPIHVYRYGIFYFIGFLLWYFFLKHLWKISLFTNNNKRQNLQKLLKNHTDDILIAVVLGWIIGWRLGHVFIYDLPYFIQNPRDIFAIRKWWMSFIGGMIGGLTWLLVLKKIKKLSRNEFLLLLDSIVIILPIGIMFGRIGNFLNQELYGILVDPNFRNMPSRLVTLFQNIHIFHHYPMAGEWLRINTNLLAGLFEWLFWFILLFLLNRKRIKRKIIKPWFLVSIFLLRYSMIRFLLEYLRQDSQAEFIWRFTKSQRFFIWFFALGLTLLIIIKKNHD